MHKKFASRLVAAFAAAVVTSAVVAALALGGSFGTQATRAAAVGSPPTPTGQLAGQLVLNGRTPIQISSFSWGASNPVAIESAGGGAGAGKASFSSLNFMKNVDASSAGLILACATGSHFDKATFTATWGTGPTAAQLVLELQLVFVDSVQQSGSGGAPSESLSLDYGKIRWTYTDAGGTTKHGWDIPNNAQW